MLGCSEPLEDHQHERNKFDGDSDLEVAGYRCPACRLGRMIRVLQAARPTVPEILAMPFPDEQVVAAAFARTSFVSNVPQAAENSEQPRPARESWRPYWPVDVPCGELRQRLLPLVFR